MKNFKGNPKISLCKLSKLKASNYLIKFFKKIIFPVVILRLYQAYGPKQSINRLIPITMLPILF